MTPPTTPPIDIAARTGRNAVHAYVSDDAKDEWSDAADTHGITMTADRILAADPGIVTDARRVFSARRKREDR